MKIGVVLAWQNEDWARYDLDDFSRPPAFPDSRVYEENRRLADLVEPLGFDSLFSVEHHTSPHHITGSGLQLLTYFAGRTERVDLGTCLIVLPWQNPVRVAEELSFLDNMLRGRRLWIGVGRGSAAREYEGLGIDMNESRQRFQEGVDILRLALSQECFSCEGRHYRIKRGIVRPRPYSSDLLDRLYAGVTTSDSLAICARMGLKVMFVSAKPWTDCAADLETFNAIRAEQGWEPIKPIIVNMLYCAPTEADAWEGAVRYIGGYFATARKHYQTDDPHRLRGIAGYEQYEERARRTAGVDPEAARKGVANNSIFGTPEQCIEKLAWMAEHLHPEQVVVMANPGMMPVEVAERSLRLFAQEVLPVAQKMAPAPFAIVGAGAGPGSR
jgi:alkanesulfonate monooxygenase SsuD/methylene tetrahydromethanopterin reductase-like flavin-dependent oxidoreductase (luciferase family)